MSPLQGNDDIISIARELDKAATTYVEQLQNPIRGLEMPDNSAVLAADAKLQSLTS